MEDDFYLRFENRFRGDRESVLEKQRQYLPMLEPLQAVFSGGITLDLGCGRGEWLELMREKGFLARGIDMNESMVETCKEYGFDVVKEDALKALRGYPDDSLAIVTGFHIIEHIPFDMLLDLVAESLRVLKPGGILILETPNPENLMVGTWSFYMDPTHNKPLPPELLHFIGEDAGFEHVKLLRLNGVGGADPASATFGDRLQNVLYDAPDCSLVAQKRAEGDRALVLEHFAKQDGARALVNDRLAELSQTFQHEYEELSHALARQDGEIAERDNVIAKKNDELNRQYNAISEKNAELSNKEGVISEKSRQISHLWETLSHEREQFLTKSNELVVEIGELRRELAEKDHMQDAMRVEEGHLRYELDRLREENHALYSSRSWRLTTPLRRLHRLSFHPSWAIKHHVARPVLLSAHRLSFVRATGSLILRPFPKTRARARRLMGFDIPAHIHEQSMDSGEVPADSAEAAFPLTEQLNENQQNCLRDLKRAIGDHERK